MTGPKDLGGSFTFAHTDMTVHRMGYGAMQLAGPRVFGPPRDRAQAIAVLREAIASGVNHFDTSDYYGPFVTNEIIRESLHPYPGGLVIVTKVGARRTEDASWLPARSPKELTDAVEDNLRRLGLDAMDVVNLRMGGLEPPEDTPIESEFSNACGIEAAGQDQRVGPQQRDARAGETGAEDCSGGLRAEFLQCRPPRRRPDYRRSRAAGHRLRSILPAGRIHTPSVR